MSIVIKRASFAYPVPSISDAAPVELHEIAEGVDVGIRSDVFTPDAQHRIAEMFRAFMSGAIAAVEFDRGLDLIHRAEIGDDAADVIRRRRQRTLSVGGRRRIH